MNKKYESLQKEIDKLLFETGGYIRNKNYPKTSKTYKSSLKKIGKLVLKLEQLEEENRKNKRENINT